MVCRCARVGVMADAAQQRIDHAWMTEEVAPPLGTEVANDDGEGAVKTLLHQLENDIRQFRF
jgi:hypothetical protein